MNFIDKKGRIIDIEESDDDCVYAYHAGEKIASFDYRRYEGIEEWDDPTFELVLMNVEHSYRKSGIGTEMIKYGQDIFVNVIYPRDIGSHIGNHLSSEGKALIESCIEKDIINSEKYYGTDEDELGEYDEYDECRWEFIRKVNDEYVFAKSKGLDRIELVVETSGGDYEVYEFEEGFKCDNLEGVYLRIEEISSDLFDLINGYIIKSIRIE